MFDFFILFYFFQYSVSERGEWPQTEAEAVLKAVTVSLPVTFSDCELAVPGLVLLSLALFASMILNVFLFIRRQPPPSRGTLQFFSHVVFVSNIYVKIYLKKRYDSLSLYMDNSVEKPK